jgi:hypothetical protein
MPRNMRLVLASLAFACIAAGAFQPFYWRVFAMNRAAMRAALVELPYRRLPGFRRFMIGVRDRTKAGERIAIVMPTERWSQGYEYGFQRATYLLSGRTTIPVVDDHDRSLRQNARQADAIAAFGVDVVAPHFATVWRSNDGVLVRRTR